MRKKPLALIAAVLAILVCTSGCALPPLPPRKPSKAPIVAAPGDLTPLIREIDGAWHYYTVDAMRRHPGWEPKKNISLTVILRPTSPYTYELARVENVQGDADLKAVNAAVRAVDQVVSRFRLKAPRAEEKAELKFTFHYDEDKRTDDAAAP